MSEQHLTTRKPRIKKTFTQELKALIARSMRRGDMSPMEKTTLLAVSLASELLPNT